MTRTTPNYAGRDRALSLFEIHREEVVKRLRLAAYQVWRQTRDPVSANDIRHVLTEVGYTGDPRILASAFPRSEWRAFGWTTTTSERAHARPIRTFLPLDRS